MCKTYGNLRGYFFNIYFMFTVSLPLLVSSKIMYDWLPTIPLTMQPTWCPYSLHRPLTRNNIFKRRPNAVINYKGCINLLGKQCKSNGKKSQGRAIDIRVQQRIAVTNSLLW